MVSPVRRQHDELAALRRNEAKAAYSLGDLPLVVTRGLNEEEGPNAVALEADHRRDQTAMTTMSRRGTHAIASRSGHHIQLDEPELVVDAIRQLLATLR